MEFDLRRHTILLSVCGSRALGTHRPDSDVDVRGVAIPPARYLLGFLKRFEQADALDQLQCFVSDLQPHERAVTADQKLEGSVYALAKVARLAADANPNIYELLFCRDDEVRVCTALGERLRAARRSFLSAKVRHTYSGYAASQLKRIETHRKWLLDPPNKQPTRAEFGLPEQGVMPRHQLEAARAAVRKQLDRWELDFGQLPPSEIERIQQGVATMFAEVSVSSDTRWQAAARTIGLDDNFVDLMDRERRYQAARQGFRQYQGWTRSRNPARAALESKFGFDTKHGAHLIRLLRMGREILSTGEVHVWRGDRDAEELRAIRDGAWPYDQLIEQANEELARVATENGANLPAKPDREALDHLVVELVEAALAA